MKTVILIDGNSLMHRAYHGIAKGFIPVWDGIPIGMVYGFASSLLNVIDNFHPDTLLVTFDTKAKTFRHELDKEYKAQREKAPDDFYAQIPYIDELLASFQIPTFKMDGFESDDLIGTLATKLSKDSEVRILSADLDFLQLVSDRISLLKFNGKIPILYGPAETKARYGIEPSQIIDYKAIVGDSSDNYKGIPGIGPKTASKLLQDFESLDGIYNHLNDLPIKVREKFNDHKDQALKCQTLATIKTDIHLDTKDQKFELHEETTTAFFEKMKFSSLINRYQKLITNFDQPRPSEQKKNTKKELPEDQMCLF